MQKVSWHLLIVNKFIDVDHNSYSPSDWYHSHAMYRALIETSPTVESSLKMRRILHPNIDSNKQKHENIIYQIVHTITPFILYSQISTEKGGGGGGGVMGCVRFNFSGRLFEFVHKLNFIHLYIIYGNHKPFPGAHHIYTSAAVMWSIQSALTSE